MSGKRKVLLIYQGRYAPPYVRAVKDLQESVDDLKVVDIGADANRNANLIREELDKATSECCAAFALITPDQRNCLKGGNLWFEMGYWIAKRGTENLYPFRIKKSTTKSAPKRKEEAHSEIVKDLIADICGMCCHVVHSVSALQAEVLKRLSKVPAPAKREGEESAGAGIADKQIRRLQHARSARSRRDDDAGVVARMVDAKRSGSGQED